MSPTLRSPARADLWRRMRVGGPGSTANLRASVRAHTGVSPPPTGSASDHALSRPVPSRIVARHETMREAL
ncbi:hypothetical protein NOSIN_09040 [Nocardiopsis sinuspersici]|uniref:Uncharacterized protein n=1 Tax=Nocardiopsis sinuspersici TaxID=501010 RepID=A0A1V3C0C4_9ACTN|nr:hypothetical protein NOSIN_09040 [Nocardiopsis sinuspersici]